MAPTCPSPAEAPQQLRGSTACPAPPFPAWLVFLGTLVSPPTKTDPWYGRLLSGFGPKVTAAPSFHRIPGTHGCPRTRRWHEARAGQEHGLTSPSHSQRDPLLSQVPWGPEAAHLCELGEVLPTTLRTTGGPSKTWNSLATDSHFRQPHRVSRGPRRRPGDCLPSGAWRERGWRL